MIEDGSAEKIEESQPPPGWSGRDRNTPVRLSDTVIVAVEDHMTYGEPTRGSQKNKWKLTQKKN